MELRKINVKSKHVVVAPLGDIQWSGATGPTAQEHVKRHIDACLKLDAWFLGMGDYIDFLSPSNRLRLASAALYDTADAVIEEKAHELTQEVYDTLLKPTKGRWLGLLEGHHFYEGQGSTSDMWLADMLDAECIGTSAYIHLLPAKVTLWAHHGMGGGQLPAAPLNKLYHVAAGLEGADVYLMGHTTKMSVARLSRPRPDWTSTTPDLTHSDIFLVNTGGFSKSNIVGHTRGRIRRGDYAEKGMMTPSPLCAPLVRIDGAASNGERIRVEV
jgi:hypothetical protein